MNNFRAIAVNADIWNQNKKTTTMWDFVDKRCLWALSHSRQIIARIHFADAEMNIFKNSPSLQVRVCIAVSRSTAVYAVFDSSGVYRSLRYLFGFVANLGHHTIASSWLSPNFIILDEIIIEIASLPFAMHSSLKCGFRFIELFLFCDEQPMLVLFYQSQASG